MLFLLPLFSSGVLGAVQDSIQHKCLLRCQEDFTLDPVVVRALGARGCTHATSFCGECWADQFRTQIEEGQYPNCVLCRDEWEKRQKKEGTQPRHVSDGTRPGPREWVGRIYEAGKVLEKYCKPEDLDAILDKFQSVDCHPCPRQCLEGSAKCNGVVSKCRGQITCVPCSGECGFSYCSRCSMAHDGVDESECGAKLEQADGMTLALDRWRQFQVLFPFS